MIAQPQPEVLEREVERVRLRSAARGRVRRTRLRIHRPVFAVIALAVLVVLPLLGYVWLTANLTSLDFARARAEHERSALIEESQRLDNTIARLESPERLAQIAAQLKMHDPHIYAVVPLAAPKLQAKPSGIAFFGWISGR